MHSPKPCTHCPFASPCPVALQLTIETEALGTVSLSGSLIRQDEKGGAAASNEQHIATMGGMIEAMENKVTCRRRLVMATACRMCGVVV